MLHELLVDLPEDDYLHLGDPSAFAGPWTRFLQLPMGEVEQVDVAPLEPDAVPS